MTKNLIKEIQELVQQIKKEYQEGIDFEFVAPSLINEASSGFRVKIISPNLKKDCREHFFGFSPNVDCVLDYEKGDPEENDFYYRINDSSVEWDSLDCAKGGIYRHNHNKTVSKKCKECGKLVSYEKGQIAEWNGKNIPGIKIVGYFHPNCAKKYFANQKPQPNENNARIKEKLLHNLDKICLDPLGDLANTELLKDQQAAEKAYHWKRTSEWKKWATKAYKVEIEEEEIDLEKDFFLGSDGYVELKRAIIQEIKQNPSEWKIVKGWMPEYECGNNNWIVQNKTTGRYHWKHGISYFWAGHENERLKYWTEIESLINGSSSPVIPTDKPKLSSELTSAEKTLVLKYMQERGIISLTLHGNLLVEEYKSKKDKKLAINSPELQNLQKCLLKTKDKSLNYEQVTDNSDNSNSTNKPKSPNHIPLWISLGVGSGIILGTLITYWVLKHKRKKQL